MLYWYGKDLNQFETLTDFNHQQKVFREQMCPSKRGIFLFNSSLFSGRGLNLIFVPKETNADRPEVKINDSFFKWQ